MAGADLGPAPAWTDADVLAVLWRFRALRQSAAQIGPTYGVTRNAVLGLVHRIDRGLDQFGGLDALDDGVMLGILDAFDRLGWGADKVARQFKAHVPGLSRNGVLGILHAAWQDLAAAGPCVAVKPANRNGGMPDLWWVAGIEARGAAA